MIWSALKSESVEADDERRGLGLDVAAGSFAAEAFRAGAEQCPIRGQ
jgi:hypothetical protein